MQSFKICYGRLIESWGGGELGWWGVGERPEVGSREVDLVSRQKLAKERSEGSTVPRR
ncbi:hypothetical protein [Lyngbya sp. PCC 8106]|uniref:hypothetical protein n=1 Tax=Lyngbya sp. (strain PCC 8106) TaxID=313612 RepID=UPI0002DD3C98|nr:hypothetical protein [Lyngbya sp. PCC 8106]